MYTMLGLSYESWRYALNASELFEKKYVSTFILRISRRWDECCLR